MKKTGLIFGVIGGTLISAMMLALVMLLVNGTMGFDGSELLGYGSMVLALSAIFFGIKSYRDNHLRGSIKFLKGLQVGLFITLVASLMYVATWEIFILTRPADAATFMAKYSECQLDKFKAGGATPEEIDLKTQEMAGFMKMYENPLIRMGMTMMEILPVGIVVTLISAAVLRRKQVLPA
jgi:hypothetical protein